MAAWRVELTPAAARHLRRVRTDELLVLRGVILGLATERHPPGARKLAGHDLWRVGLRIDGQPWRIVYQLRAADRLVVVTRVVRRDEGAYRRL
jgi:mRNA-degrading endonuclease RelE of RelBE toxin-antitoxin system